MNKFMNLDLNYDFEDDKTDIINTSNIKFSYFFYINNISNNFDLDLQDYHFDEEESINEDSFEELKEFTKITKSSIVIKIINAVFNQISGLANSSQNGLFLNLSNDEKNPMYVTYDRNNDFSHSILGNTHTNKMYSFMVKINPENELYRFTDQLNIVFYLQQETNRIVGGFVLNKTDNDSNNFSDTLDDYYIANLINSFLIDQLYPYDLELLLDIKQNYKDNKHVDEQLDPRSIQPLTMENDNLKLIKQNWDNLIWNKFLKYKSSYSEQEINYYKNTLFFSVMTTWILVVHIVEEIDEYFTSGNEQELIRLSQRKQKVANAVNNSKIEDFLDVVNYLRFTKIIDLRMRKFDNYSLSEPKLLLDVYSEQKIHLLDLNQIYKNKLLVSYFLLILFREDFGINDINSNFLSIDQLQKVLYDNLTNGFSQHQLNELTKTICTQNFDFISFINNDRIILFHGYTENQNKLKIIVGYYVWAMVYIFSKQLESQDLNTYTDYLLISNQKSKIVFFRQIIRDIEDINFNWDDDFFGVKQIKQVVFALNKQVQIVESLNQLLEKVKSEDEILKRQTERTSIILSFIVALLIGYVDFLACVFSILPCSWTVVSWNWIIGTIAFTTFTTTINLIILLLTIVYLSKLRSRYKNIDLREKRIRYEKDLKPVYVK